MADRAGPEGTQHYADQTNHQRVLSAPPSLWAWRTVAHFFYWLGWSDRCQFALRGGAALLRFTRDGLSRLPLGGLHFCFALNTQPGSDSRRDLFILHGTPLGLLRGVAFGRRPCQRQCLKCLLGTRCFH